MGVIYWSVKTICCWVLVCVVMALTGCGREDKPPPPAANPSDLPASPRGPTRAADARAAAPVIAESTDVNATLQQLTAALREYVVRTRSVPKDFDEFAAKSQARFPDPPAGQKYAVQGQAVVLVKR